MNELSTWERICNLGRWIGKKSISSPNWAKVGTETFTVSAKAITGSSIDDKVAVITRAIVRFEKAMFSETSGLLVEFFSNTVKAFEVRYESIHDFYKRAVPSGIKALETQDIQSNLVGTIHEIVLDFLDSGEPVFLWPEGTQGKITSFKVSVLDGEPFRDSNGNLGVYAGVRYDAIYIYNLPMGETP